MTSPEVDELLKAAADKVSAAASSRIGATRKKYDNKDFIVSLVEKQGDSSAYHMAYVHAGNPRSDWYAVNKGVLNI